MKKDDIKNVLGKLEPDKDIEERIGQKILEKKHNKFQLKPVISIAASLAIVVSIGVLGNNFLNRGQDVPDNNIISKGENSNTSNRDIASKVKKTVSQNSNISSAEGIHIPKIELPKETNPNVAMDMIGLIVYEGRIYTQSGTSISPENAEKLLGEKIGTTRGNIDEWSNQDDYAVEFASTIGESDVYSVKGYDKDFRIMSYNKINGDVYAEFYECLNGVTIKSGEDIFGKLKIENNIKSAKHEAFESWNYSKGQYKELTNLETLNSFVAELKNTIPYTQESLMHLFDDNAGGNQKFVYVALNDGSEIQLRLFKDGYVFYNSSHIFFEMKNEVFNKLWNELE